jgi:hypothetical protein
VGMSLGGVLPGEGALFSARNAPAGIAASTRRRPTGKLPGPFAAGQCHYCNSRALCMFFRARVVFSCAKNSIALPVFVAGTVAIGLGRVSAAVSSSTNFSPQFPIRAVNAELAPELRRLVELHRDQHVKAARGSIVPKLIPQAAGSHPPCAPSAQMSKHHPACRNTTPHASGVDDEQPRAFRSCSKSCFQPGSL